MDFIMTIVEQGLIYGILTLGIYITYKILDFPDLTVDGGWRYHTIEFLPAYV